MDNKLEIEYCEEMIQPPGEEYCDYSPVYMDGTEIGVVTLTDEFLEGKFTGKTLYLFYPHDTPDIGYEASTCEQAVRKYMLTSDPVGPKLFVQSL